MKTEKPWLHYYLIVGVGCDSRNWYTINHSESEARAEGLRAAERWGVAPVVRIRRKLTRPVG